MPRYTSSYSDFVERIEEVRILRIRAAKLERSKSSYEMKNEINALCRGGVVLLSSHIEAYIKELGELVLDSLYLKGVCRSKLAPQFFYHVSKNRIDSIRNTPDPQKIANHLFKFLEDDQQIWSKSAALPLPILSDKFNSGFSNPRIDKIKTYFARFGYNDYSRDFNLALTKDAHAVVTGLNNIVDTRNLIAHGDTSANKTPGDLELMINNAKIFCRTTDSVFSAWCSRKLCSVR